MKNLSNSQIGQDVFVVNMLKEKTNGLFLDIGAGEPIRINNTYLLEKQYNWSGISIELDPVRKEEWSNSDRKTEFLLHDALTVDYDAVLSNLLSANNRDRIDYLSMDLEPPELTLEALYKLPLEKYRFSVITYEHDLYRNNHDHMLASREVFTKNNYKLVFTNNQEDWWVDSTHQFE